MAASQVKFNEKTHPRHCFSNCRKVLHFVAFGQNTNGKVFSKVLPFVHDGGADEIGTVLSIGLQWLQTF
jgi:hypothetical protein